MLTAARAQKKMEQTEEGEKDGTMEIEFASAMVAELAETEKDRMRRQERDSMHIETYLAETSTGV